MTGRSYTAIVHDAEEGGFWATCAEAPEADGQGESLEEVLEDLKAAIVAVLELKREEGAEPLVERTRMVTLEISETGAA